MCLRSTHGNENRKRLSSERIWARFLRENVSKDLWLGLSINATNI